MHRYAYQGRMLTINELSEMSGIRHHTLRDRLRRGYTVEQAVRPSPLHESVTQFCDASHWKDWIGEPIHEVYEVYWKWCVNHQYQPVAKQGFSRQLKTIYPQLKTVPTKRFGGCDRVIRVRE